MASLTFQNFIFFLGSGRPKTRFSSNVVLIFQKSLNVWKDFCLEAKHVGAHLMDLYNLIEKNSNLFKSLDIFCMKT